MANAAGQEQQLVAGWRAIERSDSGAAEAIARDLLRQGPSHPQLGVLACNLLAVSLMQQSRYEEALVPLASALEREPRSAGTHLNLGSALIQLGRHAEAIPHFRKAVEIEPLLSQAHNNLGHALKELGRFDEAAESYRRALRIAPDDLEVHNNLGTVLAAVGRRDEAAASYRKALALNPRHLPALNNLGVVLDQLDRGDEALECFQKVIALDPGNPDAHTNMGVVYQRMQRVDEAVEAHRKAISIAPRVAGAHVNLALALREQGLIEAAAESLQRALSLEENYAEAHANLGMIYRQQGRQDEAIACLQRALSIKPGYVDALLHLGASCQERGRMEEAVGYFRKAIALEPGSAGAHHNLGVVLQGLSRHDEAIACFREVLKLDPEHKYTLGARLWSELLTCRWDALESETAELKTAIREGKSVTEPFTLIAVSQEPGEQRLCATRFYEDRLRTGRVSLWRGERYRHEKVRVAYLSADFREHAVAYCIEHLIELHDRSKFEIIGASYGADDGSEIRSRLVSAFDRFLDLRSVGDPDAAKVLREAEVDIVVDLMGYTRGCRPGILAYRPAPVQAGYLGFPGTTGADFIDYLIADRFVIPEEDRRHYSEQVVYLPGTYMVNHSRRVVAEPPRRTEVGLPEAGFVFCCFNNNYKITPEVFDVWMRLLSKVGDSVLWLAGGNPSTEANLLKEAARRGVDPGRLVFTSFTKRIEEHYARYRLADVFLDTAYNGHVTATDALWVGLPVLTCAGKAFAGRVAGSLLRSVGLPELITHSLDEYEAAALRLADDMQTLQVLRERLEKNKRSASLFDADGFRRDIESAYTTMREIARRGEEPRAFSVSAIE